MKRNMKRGEARKQQQEAMKRVTESLRKEFAEKAAEVLKRFGK